MCAVKVELHTRIQYLGGVGEGGFLHSFKSAPTSPQRRRLKSLRKTHTLKFVHTLTYWLVAFDSVESDTDIVDGRQDYHESILSRS